MKSFLLISIGFAIVISTLAAPQSNGIEKIDEDEDAEARTVIAELLTLIQAMSGKHHIFTTSLIKSVDQDCMLQKYKKHNLVDGLSEEGFDIRRGRPINSWLVFANLAMTCSNKFDGLLTFVFDNLFSYSSLLEVFRDDEPIKQFLDDLQCYNNYAIENNFLDANLYPKLKHDLVNHTVEECKKVVNDAKVLLTGAIDMGGERVVIDRKDCLLDELKDTAEKTFLKYILLVPAGLSDDQKKLLKANFIKDVHGALERILLCNVSEVESSNDNEV